MKNFIKIIDTYYTTTSQIPNRSGSLTYSRFETVEEAYASAEANTFNMYTIRKVTVIETILGNFEHRKTIIGTK